MLRNKLFVLVSVLIATSMVLAACAPQQVEVVKTVVVTEIVEQAGATQVVEKVITATPEAPQEQPAFLAADSMVPCKPLPAMALSNPSVAQAVTPDIASASTKIWGAPKAVPDRQGGKVYKVGVHEDVTSLNYFQANGADNTVWNSYMLPGRLTMFALSDKTFTLVPFVAAEMPPPLTEENGKWVTTVKMREDVTWSDGTPFTAEDVAFTANTILKFGFISGNWQQWYDGNFLESVEAADTYSAKYIYHTKPGLARHENGSLQAPILSKAYWEPVVNEAAAPIDALGANPAADALTAAQTEAQATLTGHVPDGEPLAGAFTLQRWETGAFLELKARGDYFYSGLTYQGYNNGAYTDSTGFTSGTPEGDPVVDAEVGPFVDSVVYTIYGSQDAAVLALKNGEIDFELNSLGLPRGLWLSVQGDANLTAISNPTNGFRYLSFNNRRRPMNDCAFRQALAVLIDKEFVTATILQGVAYPVYTFVPEGNKAWFFADTPKLGQGLDREHRVALAVAILEGAGYTWEGDQKPTWDADNRQVVAAGHLIMPDGTPVPPLNMLAPSPGYDPLRSTFAIWIETWANEFGIPLKANLAGFNVIVPKIFSEQDFDMYILGWSLSVFPSYLRDFFSEEQAALEGNNAGGYINQEFEDASAGLLTCETLEACKQLSDQIQVLLGTELPYVLLFDTGILEAFRSASVEYPYTEQLSGLQYTHQFGWTQLQTQVKVK
jgi:ABC-type transport system substrate-binding protein